MTSSPKYNLKWKEFKNAVSTSFGSLRADKELCDVTLVSDQEQHVSAHKVVLSTSSKFFKSLFSKISGPTPVVYLGGVDTKNLNYVLDYIYIGEVQLLHEDVDHFLENARKFKIHGLEAESDAVDEQNGKLSTFIPLLIPKTENVDNTDLIQYEGQDQDEQESQSEMGETRVVPPETFGNINLELNPVDEHEPPVAVDSQQQDEHVNIDISQHENITSDPNVQSQELFTSEEEDNVAESNRVEQLDLPEVHEENHVDVDTGGEKETEEDWGDIESDSDVESNFGETETEMSEDTETNLLGVAEAATAAKENISLFCEETILRNKRNSEKEKETGTLNSEDFEDIDSLLEGVEEDIVTSEEEENESLLVTIMATTSSFNDPKHSGIDSHNNTYSGIKETERCENSVSKKSIQEKKEQLPNENAESSVTKEKPLSHLITGQTFGQLQLETAPIAQVEQARVKANYKGVSTSAPLLSASIQAVSHPQLSSQKSNKHRVFKNSVTPLTKANKEERNLRERPENNLINLNYKLGSEEKTN